MLYCKLKGERRKMHLSKANSRRIHGSIAITLILVSVFAFVRVPRVAKATPGAGPQFGNVGPADGTSVSEGENLTLYAQGYSDTGLDWAWLSTNETGTWKNYTQLWSAWQASGSNPIVDGDSLFGSGYQTEDNKVLKVNGTYYMVTSSGSSMNAMQIYMLNSSSLTGPWSVMNNGQPIIPHGASGWDQGQLRVAGPVIYDNGTYYLYYMGTDASGMQSIGVATTSDAKFPSGWTKYGGNPILTPTGSGWESAGIYSLCIARIGPPGNEWYGHYTGRTSGYIWALGICYGDSPYGPFTRYGNNPILERGVGEWDNLGLPRTDFIEIGDTIYGAYESAKTSGSPPNWDFQVGEYDGEITDGILNVTFSKNPNNPIIPGNAGSALQTANPHWYYENGTRYLFVGSCGQGAGPTWRYVDLFSSSSMKTGPVNMYDVAHSWSWSNFTWSNPSVSSGTTIQWSIYYNDTDGNVNGTGIHSFTVKSPEYDYVDLDTSDVDSNGNKGTHSNFENEKACDSSYDTLSEENTGGFGIMSYRKNITINHNYVGGDLNDFPVLVDVYDMDLHNDVQSSGNDIAFTDSSGRKLDHQIEYFNKNYNSTHAHLVAWVKANLTGTSDTTICMIYGNPTSGSQQNPTGVWDSNFIGVWHMNETNAVDSTASGNNGTSSGGVVYTVSGKIDGALSFDGSTGYVRVPDRTSLNATKITVEAWVYLDTTPTDMGTIATRYYTHYFTVDSSRHLENYLYTPGDSGWKTSASQIPLNTWVYVAYTYNGSDLSQFISGADDKDFAVSGDLQPGGSTSGNWILYFGAQFQSGAPTRKLDGTLDEIRISNVARSTAWITTTYYCMNNQTSFRTIGNEETGAFGVPTNYELDLEVQWTNVNYTRTHKELCIKTGTFSNSEDLQVRIWNSTDNVWHWIMNLTANQWNNVSVTSHLTESTFTVQFLKSGDTSRHSWNIDCSLIHTWDQAGLHIDPPQVQKTPNDIGTYFNVSIDITGVTDLFGFDLNVTWDNTLITFDNCYYNRTLDALWGSGNWFVAESETGSGWCKLVAVSTKDSFNTTGSQALFTLEYRVQDPQSNFVRETLIHFDNHKLSDSQYTAIIHTVTDGIYRTAGKTPTLQMSPTSKTCRKYRENFTAQIGFSDAFNVTDFKFEIHYNATLLDYVGVTWNAWASGTITVDEANGIITGVTSGTATSGTQTLVTIEFNATYYHIWKDESKVSGWKNDQSGLIYVQWANLSYASSPDLGYVRDGAQNQINVGPDVTYNFSPIQGDIDNNGTVDVFDIRTVAAFYDQSNTTYDLNGDGIIDIFDLVVIGANFDYTYNP
jgi:hypothetical protein